MPSWFEKAQQQEHEAFDVDINGSLLSVYHRTRQEEVAEGICDIGFIAGGGDYYGKGIYATYDLASQLRNNMSGYGGYVIKGTVDISGFLIFDYDIAKQVYGGNYTLLDQVKALGMDKIVNGSLDDAKIQERYEEIKRYSERLEGGGNSSDIAHPMSSKYKLENAVRGIIFTGGNDGRVCVSYREINVTPVAHAWIDGATWRNPKWQNCPERTAEELAAMRQDEGRAEAFAKERQSLMSDLRGLRDADDLSSITYANYPNVPKNIFNTLVGNFVYEDETRIDKLPQEVVANIRDIIEVEFRIKKFNSDPRLYWEEWKALPEDLKEKIPFDIIIDSWQKFIDAHKGRWTDVPDEIKDALDATGEMKYWRQAVLKNPKNWQFIPKDIAERLKERFDLDAPEGVGENFDIGEQEKTDVYDIPIGQMKWVDAQIDKLNKKAAKLGLPPMNVEVIGEDRKSRTKQIRVIGNVPMLDGWKLLARLTPAEDDAGKAYNEINLLADEEIPDHYEQSDPDCNHCGHKRKRKKLYVVKNIDQQRSLDEVNADMQQSWPYALIGSTCIGDFVNDTTGNPERIARYAEEISKMFVIFNESNMFANQDEAKIRKHFKSKGIPIDFFLGRVMAAWKHQGDYLGKSQARSSGQDSTGDLAYRMCLDSQTDADVMKNVSVSSSDMILVENALEWIANIDTSRQGGFLAKLQDACAADTVTKRNSGIISWLPKSFRNHMDREEGDWNYEQLLAPKGETIAVSCKVIDQRPVSFNIIQQATNGAMSLYVGQTQYGDLVAWDYATNDFGANKGDTVNLKGTVTGFAHIGKKHATALGSVEVVDDQTYKSLEPASEKITNDFRAKNALPAAHPASKKKQPARPQPAQPAAGQPAYQDGEQIETDFLINSVRKMNNQWGVSYLHQMQDDWGKKVSAFLKNPLQEGDRMRLQAKVKLNRGYTNLQYVKVLGPAQAQQPQQTPQMPPQPTPTVAPPQTPTQPTAPQQPPQPPAPPTSASGSWFKRTLSKIGQSVSSG